MPFCINNSHFIRKVIKKLKHRIYNNIKKVAGRVKTYDSKNSWRNWKFTSQKVIPPRNDNSSLKPMRPKPGDKF